MCDRLTQAYTWAELVTLYGVTQLAMNLRPSYNIAPTAKLGAGHAAADLARCAALPRSPMP